MGSMTAAFSRDLRKHRLILLRAGSPIRFYADVVAPGHVTAYGPGLVTGKVNCPADFTIVTKDAGAGEHASKSNRCAVTP